MPGEASLPRHPIELSFLSCLLAELSVMVLAQVDATGVADEPEVGQRFLHFLRGKGALGFLPAPLSPAHLGRRHSSSR